MQQTEAMSTGVDFGPPWLTAAQGLATVRVRKPGSRTMLRERHDKLDLRVGAEEAMLGRATYLALLAGCAAVTLPLELVLRARVYARPRRWLVSLLPVFVAFTLWDYLAIRRGHWWYNPRYTTGVAVLRGVLPLEELVFFVVVPTCAILTYQAVCRLLPPRRERFGSAGPPGREQR